MRTRVAPRRTSPSNPSAMMFCACRPRSAHSKQAPPHTLQPPTQPRVSRKCSIRVREFTRRTWMEVRIYRLQELTTLPKIVNHCGIHSAISNGSATCLASCVLRFACGKLTANIRVDAAVIFTIFGSDH